jgi:hypothetical protein
MLIGAKVRHRKLGTVSSRSGERWFVNDNLSRSIRPLQVMPAAAFSWLRREATTLLHVRGEAQHPDLGVVLDRAGRSIDMDLVAMQRHQAIRHPDELRVEHQRDNVAWPLRDGHIEQPRLANMVGKHAALGPIFNSQIADVERRVGNFFRGQRDAIAI